MTKGDKVKCGRVDMGRYTHNGGLESRWFTGCVGTLTEKPDGVYPPSWYIEVNGRTIMLAEDEFEALD
jgi:hypothetical protein